MKKQLKKLVLTKETLQSLDARKLRQVRGGQDEISYTFCGCEPPETIPSICNC